jgi:hypothetical protein
MTSAVWSGRGGWRRAPALFVTVQEIDAPATGVIMMAPVKVALTGRLGCRSWVSVQVIVAV